MVTTKQALPVVVVSHNTRELLRRCLAALLRSESVSAQPIVVDNASTDGSAQMVCDAFPCARVIALQTNLGFAVANNLALRALGFGETVRTRSPVSQSRERGSDADQSPTSVLLLNPDTEVQPVALTTLLTFMRERPRVGLVGAQLLYPDGRLQQSAFRFPGLTQTFFDFVPLHHRLRNSRVNGRYPQRDRPFEIDHPLGACMLVRAQTIREVGLLDEGYFMYVEEVDWCRRIQQAGWQVWCEPRAHVVHHEAQATRQNQHAMYVEKWRSRLHYFRKFHSPLYLTLLAVIIRFGLWGERLKVKREPLANDERLRRLDAVAQVRALL